MKRTWLIGCILLAAVSASAQNTLVPSVSNYHLTWTTINPAFSGFRDAISVSSLYRTALYGKLGPSDAQLNVHTPIGNSKVAIGGVVAYDNIPDVQKLYSVMSTYAYRIYLGSGRLSFGLSAGVYGDNGDLSQIDLRDENDPAFPGEAYQRWFPNFGTGVLYYADNFFVGLSVPELLSIPTTESEGIGKARLENYRFILTGAYQFNFSKNFRLKPSLWIDYNQASTSFKASLNMGFLDSRIYVGGAYDYPNFAIALLNFQVNAQWLLGYAYTFNTGPVRRALGGSHEVVLRWELRPVIRTIPDDPFYF
jgi:type IX secretion system PorP/SprF family membrane protein